MGSISAHMHSCMHCGRAQKIPWLPLCRMLQCAAMASNVAQFKDKDFGQRTGMRPGCPGAVHSVTGVGRPSRETKVLYWNAVATLFRPLAEAVLDDEDDGSGLEDSCDILTVSVLQGSQVAPGLSIARIRPRFKRLHTYHAHNVGFWCWYRSCGHVALGGGASVVQRCD
jgi:hypothetical protein